MDFLKKFTCTFSAAQETLPIRGYLLKKSTNPAPTNQNWAFWERQTVFLIA
jgi:hypothetical protein